jgi:hypothetical protein
VVAHQVADAVGGIARERHHGVDVVAEVDEETVAGRLIDELDHVRPRRLRRNEPIDRVDGQRRNRGLVACLELAHTRYGKRQTSHLV